MLSRSGTVLLVGALAFGSAAPTVSLQVDPRDGDLPIRLDTVASDARGRDVADLDVGDFELMESGVPRAIDGVRFVRSDGHPRAGETLAAIETRADEEKAASSETARLFAIFLDEYHVAAGGPAERARAALTRFVREDLGPADLVVTMRPMDSLVSIRMTRDREAILQQIGAFTPRKGDYTARSAFERSYIAGSPERVDALRAQVALSALRALTGHLGALGSTRKTVIIVSEGFVRGQRRRGDESLPTLEAVVRTANRLNVSIYAVDPRAFEAPPDPTRSSGAGSPAMTDLARETLSTLAAATGGRSFFGPEDLTAGLSRIASDSGGYYLLSFSPPQAPSDLDRFHAIQLRSKRAGVQLRTRHGYWTPTPESLRARMTSIHQIDTPRVPEWPTRSSPLIRPWFGLMRGAEGRTRVSVVWEPAAPIPGARGRTELPARVTLKAQRPDGTEVFEGTLHQTGPLDEAGELSRTAVFELPPGRLRVRMAIEDSTSRLLDTDVRELAVRALTGPVVFGTPQVLRARTAREFRALAANPDAAPVASRNFTRSERLLIRVPVYAEAGQAVLTARLATALGRSMRELRVTMGTETSVREIDLPLAGLAAGEYRVDLSARADDAEAAEVVTFRVRQ
jgi:VWFA-related protein